MELAKIIEHTHLSANTLYKDIERLCEEAKQHHFYGVCVPPYFVRDTVRLLQDTPVKTVTVIGFPMGYSTTPAKVEEVKRAIDEGVDEVDVVVNITAVKHKNWAYVRNDLDAVTRATHLKGKVIKVILETTLLEEAELIKLCQICSELDVNYVKTSTGYNGTNATPELVRLLKNNISGTVKIKASGGIRTQSQALALVEAGASKIGTSRGIEII